MLDFWCIDHGTDAKPVAHGGDLTKGDAGLRHAERSGIHTEKHDALRGGSNPKQIFLVRFSGVTQRIVNVGDRWLKLKAIDLRRKLTRRVDQLLARIG